MILLISIAAFSLHAADWPEWRGAGRQGVWNETGIVRAFAPAGLTVKWSAPIHPGYSGPSVAQGRVFVMDHEKGPATSVTERILCLDEATGHTLWTHSWPADYRGLDYHNGPRITPTVDQDRVYALGAKGMLFCLRTRDGKPLWSSDFVRDFDAQIPGWGASNAPIVHGNLVIAIVGGKGDAKVVAFDKFTGKPIWRALSSQQSEQGYSQPVIVHNPSPQLIVWHAGAIDALHPATGKHLWSHPFRIRMNTPIATPAWSAPHLLVSAFFDGGRMLQLGPAQPALLWRSEDGNEVKSDKLHTLMSQPLIEGDYVYGICSFGQLRCLRRSTGERVWESQVPTVERTRNVSAWLIRHRDRTVIFNDRGELIFAHLRPSGYDEISRTTVIAPTSPAGGRREKKAVVWSHPAFANRHMIVRNDERILRVSLQESDYPAPQQP
ncbi:MAG: PQQ-like beta-propeller repeat protein [Bryobacterales bacterium]|nr:PQQ-like beta-propeller repeat protein [Bryobacterales bacterium]